MRLPQYGQSLRSRPTSSLAVRADAQVLGERGRFEGLFAVGTSLPTISMPLARDLVVVADAVALPVRPRRHRGRPPIHGRRRARAACIARGASRRRKIASDRRSGLPPRYIDSPRLAPPHLPRLPAARHRLERLQRRARRGARAARATRCTCCARRPAPSSSGSSTRSAAGRAGSWPSTRCGARRYEGTCTVYRPDIGGLLPVYVYDDYEGFEVRTFDKLDDAELDRYLDANVDGGARRRRARGHRSRLREPPPDGPGDPRARPRRAPVRGEDPRLGARVHAQAALQALRSLRERGTRAGEARCWSARATRPRACGRRCRSRACASGRSSGPPGVDVHTFVPRDKAAATTELDGLVRWLDTAERTGFDPAAAEAIDLLCHPRRDKPPDAEELAAVRATYDANGIDVAAPDGLAALDPERGADRLLRRQADRLEGRRPAAGGLAARAGARAARASS